MNFGFFFSPGPPTGPELIKQAVKFLLRAAPVVIFMLLAVVAAVCIAWRLS